MRRYVITLLFLVLAPPSFAADSTPQAVAALQYLRPRTDNGPVSWTNGEYKYDGAGNIYAIGNESYAYDKLSRLEKATLRGPDMTSLQTQTFDYDAYGNLISTSKLGQTVGLDTSTLTNQLNALHYDASGNVDIAGTQHYDYDAAGMPNTVRLGANMQPRIIYAYTADDERLFAFDVSTGITHWTLRGLDNRALRDFKQSGATWSVERDYVYRDGLLLAALKPSGAVEHYTLDHLGTPRLITDGAGRKVAYHAYWPFGEEWSLGTAQEASPLKFTGHERDADPTGGSAPLDYLHARYYGAGWGRFLAVDPGDSSAEEPQTWNRYVYARNNPILHIDPDGRQAVIPAPGVSPVAPLSLALYHVQQMNANSAYRDSAVGVASTSIAFGKLIAVAASTLLKPAWMSRPHVVTPTGVILPGGKDVNLVPTAAGASDGTGWVQIHDSHPHDGAQPHTHYPETQTGDGKTRTTREDRPTTADDIDEADQNVKDGKLRPRKNRQDKGDAAAIPVTP
ncbi:MAG TPA: RHS repeat-associated core domain-containing protein [Thermoanaerobaculia bacterium]|jgi:RHS repeat-associated protein|nr:RHS repeat-associated core domain-containing protein [Thermoanaerobaculia bacterium]